ncbi:MAG: Queuine tRNA-ribosyltransferase [Synergistales bacterium 53_16]|nr:MAG: Queuine tRNA-ribosyltransferase [Synergistales bacterium 53_16]KUL03840.1 MAG: Queuine tRNA-ribosyltransferase [Synergistales bacterium 54_9]
MGSVNGLGCFRIEASCQKTGARAGILETRHGFVKTPVFMPVGTQATVKAMAPFELKAIGSQIILSNTYHLYLRPGQDVINEAGGLHKFMGWDRPILTDSGGFQVFSLSDLREVNDEGVVFQSHLDGRRHFLTPELAVSIQEKLGSDIAMCLDECVPYPCDEKRSAGAVKRTIEWAARCKKAHSREGQLLFGIVQGSIFPSQRRHCAEALSEADFPGYGIGGLSVGEPHEIMYEMLDELAPVLPALKPRYLMGVGYPPNLIEGVARGVDMFDCVLPTRLGRNGTVFTSRGRLNIKNSVFERDFGPIEQGCTCYACRTVTRAYIRHLYRSREILASRLCTWHNLHFLQKLMERVRSAIVEGTFEMFRKEFNETFRDGENTP